jgi:hypothetical protein
MANSPDTLENYNFLKSWNKTRDGELSYMQFITNRTSEYALLEGWLEFSMHIPALEELSSGDEESSIAHSEVFNSIATIGVSH